MVDAPMDETRCHTSSVDISTVTESKTCPFDADNHSPRKNKKRRKRSHRKRKRDDNAKVGDCLVKVDSGTEMKLKNENGEHSSPGKKNKRKRKRKPKKYNATENNDKSPPFCSDLNLPMVKKKRKWINRIGRPRNGKTRSTSGVGDSQHPRINLNSSPAPEPERGIDLNLPLSPASPEPERGINLNLPPSPEPEPEGNAPQGPPQLSTEQMELELARIREWEPARFQNFNVGVCHQ